MTTITNEHRCTILSNIITQTFNPRIRQIQTEATDLASRLYVSWLGDRLDFMKKLPADWFNFGFPLTVRSAKPSRAEGVIMLAPRTIRTRLHSTNYHATYVGLDVSDSVKVADTLPVPKGAGYGFHIVVPGTEKEILAHNTKLRTLVAETNKLLTEVKPLILGTKSLEKLRKQWPQVEPFLPEELKNPVKINLPVVRVDYINQLINEAKAKAPAPVKAAKKGEKK